MAADISSVVASAIASRDWWGNWADVAAVAVAVGVIVESVTDFDFLAKAVGLSNRSELKKSVAKAGLGLLIVALMAEVVIGWHISAATTTIETNLTRGMNRAVAANEQLDRRLREEEDDLTASQHQIDDLAATEKTLRDTLENDERAIRKQAEYLLGRRLTRKQYEAIRSLRGRIPQLFILTEPHCPECLNFAAQIADVFTRAAGTKVSLTFLNEFEGAGDVCLYDVSPYTETLRGAFNKGKLAYELCPKLPENVRTDGTVPIISVLEGPGFTTAPKLGPWPWQPGGAWHIKSGTQK